MEYRKITAIIRNSLLEKVEDRLRLVGVKGISVSRVKGFGDYANFFRNDLLTSHSRIEIFASAEEVKKIADTIMDYAHTGHPGDGLIAVLPVENILRIKDCSKAHAGEI